MKKYYEAYDERYKIVHKKGISWLSEIPTPIVLDVLNRYNISKSSSILEIGCGEGRDAKHVLEHGFHLLATDISKEAIDYCRRMIKNDPCIFKVMDCLSQDMDCDYDMIYSVAVIHMLVLDEDRQRFYQFINKHLKKDGYALICTMGDGTKEFQIDISTAFDLQERDTKIGKIKVTGTSCRMVSFGTFEKELRNHYFKIVEKGITTSLPDFYELMYVVIKRED